MLCARTFSQLYFIQTDWINSDKLFSFYFIHVFLFFHVSEQKQNKNKNKIELSTDVRANVNNTFVNAFRTNGNEKLNE